MYGKFCDRMGRNTWQKQEFYKGRSWVYGTGWAGWGFESNVTAQVVNAASPETLRGSPIFEHDPDEMFSVTITTNMQNRILAKGIPALSRPLGVIQRDAFLHETDMNSYGSGFWWGNRMDAYRERWLHSDIQNLSFFFSWRVFTKIVDEGDVK